jgi:DNA-binding CsgD family transcriptional regulator
MLMRFMFWIVLTDTFSTRCACMSACDNWPHKLWPVMGCWLHLHALSPLRVLGVFGDQPLVLATLFHPQHFKALDPLALGDLFGMTPTEAKVATLVADGLDAGQMATRLQVQVSTIRTHLRQVFAKIGAQRMADAVRLLHQGDALWAQPSRNK